MLILYLEDRQDKIAEVKGCVDSLGYRLRICNTVPAALRALEQRVFDLVISGVHLELDNALDLVRSIRRNPNLRHLPIILMDSHQTRLAKRVNDSLAIACQTLGVTHYLPMSEFDSRQLSDLLRQTIESVEVDAHVPPQLVLPTSKLSRADAAFIEESNHDGQRIDADFENA